MRFAYLLPANPLLFSILFAYFAFVISLLVILSVYDLKHKILPDAWTMLFASVAFIGMFFIQGDAIILHIPSGWNFIAGIVLPAPFSLIWLASKGKWMGLGDAKLMIGIGFLLGLSAGTAALLLSFWIGAAVSVLILVVSAIFTPGKAGVTWKTAIPFGPFLALGTVIAIVGQVNLGTIMQWFVR
jgi:prepilin signal peptidase PulO-like enzyme (type II secretory pathway)